MLSSSGDVLLAYLRSVQYGSAHQPQPQLQPQLQSPDPEPTAMTMEAADRTWHEPTDANPHRRRPIEHRGIPNEG